MTTVNRSEQLTVNLPAACGRPVLVSGTSDAGEVRAAGFSERKQMSTMKQLIKSEPVMLEPVINESPIAERDGLVALAASLPMPSDMATAAECSNVGGMIQRRIKDVEAMEADIREPVNAWLKKLRDVRDGFLAPLVAQKQRLADGYAAFQASERERVAAETAARQKAIDEAAAALRAEQAKLADTVQTMVCDADLQKALDAEARSKQAEQELRDVVMFKPSMVKAGGAVSGSVVCFEVTDIVALYNATKSEQGHSWAVKLEENRAGIKASIQASTKLPGLRVWTEEKATFRSR